MEIAVLQFWCRGAALPACLVQDILFCPSQRQMAPGWRTASDHVFLNYP